MEEIVMDLTVKVTDLIGVYMRLDIHEHCSWFQRVTLHHREILKMIFTDISDGNINYLPYITMATMYQSW